MGSDLTAAEVVSLVSPVAGRLGINACTVHHLSDGSEQVEMRFGLDRDTFRLDPPDAARLIVGMIAEKCDHYGAGYWSVFTITKNDAAVAFDGPRTLRSILAASCAAFARATEGGA